MRPLLVSLAAALLTAGSAAAQVDTPAIVSADGSATLTRPPQMMRMRVDVMSKAATLEEALAGLKQQTAKAKTQLVEFGADADSIRVEAPRVTSLKTEQQRQMEELMRQRLERAGRGQAKARASMPVIVAATLEAQWKLNSTEAEQILLQVHPLQEKIRAADIGQLPVLAADS
ncbi:MAG: hypothetical protein KY476_11635, partial [Planctomycetes bacterium]|nr:hypothetical protein [Planctomycetota bacterium]